MMALRILRATLLLSLVAPDVHGIATSLPKRTETTNPLVNFFSASTGTEPSTTKPRPLPSNRLASRLPSNVCLQKLDRHFTVVATDGDSTVLEAPVREDSVRLFIAVDGQSFGPDRPGNGGIRMLAYENDQQALLDALRLAQGMTKKHDQFRTGFSGAKLVVQAQKDIEQVQRKELMQDTAKALRIMGGSLYTGCDLNTGDLDMDYLTEASDDRYVLAGRNSKVDTNVATASSVIGSITGLCEAHGLAISDLTFTVQGCGKVGSTVAKELVRLGAGKVQTCDIRAESARVEGCVEIQDWTATACDVLVPCANSLAITEDIARNFPKGLKLCTGATNSPFASAAAQATFAKRGVSFVPESISSAGAILADSVEWYDKNLYQTVEPTLLYGWVRSLSHNKARRMAQEAKLDANRMASVLPMVTPTRTGDPVGSTFPEWIKENTIQTDTLIVGGGCAGTATAFALSEKGRSSLLLERGATLAPSAASSYGDSRMYRQMYSDPFFSRMQKTALGRWKQVEKLSGQKLLQENGLLFYGEDTGETVEGSVLGAKQTMEQLGLPHTYFESGNAIADAYPALEGCRNMPYTGVREATAGHIRASQACQAMADAAGELCRVKTNADVRSLQVLPTNDAKNYQRIIATTADGVSIHANNLVLCAGPWTNELLRMANLPCLNLKIWQVQWAHYEVPSTDIAQTIPQAFFFRKGLNNLDGGLYYVFPANATECKQGESSYVKVGVDYPTGGDLHAMGEFNYAGSPKVLELMDGWAQEHLPGVGKRVDSYTSPYTMTDDSYFVMDQFAPGVAVFAGGSGRAFKFGPLLGDCLASLVTGDDTRSGTTTTSPIDLDRFSARRQGLVVSEVEARMVDAVVTKA